MPHVLLTVQICPPLSGVPYAARGAVVGTLPIVGVRVPTPTAEPPRPTRVSGPMGHLKLFNDIV